MISDFTYTAPQAYETTQTSIAGDEQSWPTDAENLNQLGEEGYSRTLLDGLRETVSGRRAHCHHSGWRLVESSLTSVLRSRGGSHAGSTLSPKSCKPTCADSFSLADAPAYLEFLLAVQLTFLALTCFLLLVLQTRLSSDSRSRNPSLLQKVLCCFFFASHCTIRCNLLVVGRSCFSRYADFIKLAVLTSSCTLLMRCVLVTL